MASSSPKSIAPSAAQQRPVTVRLLATILATALAAHLLTATLNDAQCDEIAAHVAGTFGAKLGT